MAMAVFATPSAQKAKASRLATADAGKSGQWEIFGGEEEEFILRLPEKGGVREKEKEKFFQVLLRKSGLTSLDGHDGGRRGRRGNALLREGSWKAAIQTLFPNKFNGFLKEELII